MISVGKMSSGITLRVRSGDGTWAPFSWHARITLAETANVNELIVHEREPGHPPQRERDRAVADPRDRFGSQEIRDDLLLDPLLDDVERRRLCRPIAITSSIVSVAGGAGCCAGGCCGLLLTEGRRRERAVASTAKGDVAQSWVVIFRSLHSLSSQGAAPTLSPARMRVPRRSGLLLPPRGDSAIAHADSVRPIKGPVRRASARRRCSRPAPARAAIAAPRHAVDRHLPASCRASNE